MKKDIHPKYFDKARVTCACGNTFTVGSTQEYINVDVCSKCHPFYTGKEKVMDTMGRVEKFKKKLAKKEELKGKTGKKKEKRAAKAKAKAKI
ncbi:MAG: 50S ribosomal protein L31 [bacterium]|nr:50S ribosomal protein L31 [bacterium]